LGFDPFRSWPLAETETTNLRIIHGPDNQRERTRHGSFAAVGSNVRMDTRTRRPIMDPVFRVMCDVAGLVTRGSDAARMETRRMAAERERSSATLAEQPITAGPSAGGHSFALPYKWLKLAFRSS
jgi:hypothetical protein